jgi:phage gpG-like protein
MEISVTSFTAKSISNKLKRATQTMIKKSMGQVGLEYKRFIVKRFLSQPPEWPPKKRPNGKPTLVDTGRLRSDVKHLSTKLVGNKLTTSVKTPYAKYHQFGTSRMPKRTILVKPSKAVMQKMVTMLRHQLVRNLR